jgi:signal transduction histidine kinase/DNA-binding response OmpR family regulator
VSDQTSPSAATGASPEASAKPGDGPLGGDEPQSGSGSDGRDGRRAAKLVKALADEITLIDAHGGIVSSTAGDHEALGYEPSWWRSRNIFDLTHPDDVQRASQALADLIANPGGADRQRFRAKHASGHWETVEIFGTNLLHDPDVEAVVLSTRVVTHEERLAAAHQEAEKQAGMQAEYVASVSHELRSPIHGILGVADLLADQLDGEPAELVDVIRSEGNRLRRVVDDVLDYAKMSQGGLELRPTPTDVVQIFAAVSSIVSPLVEGEVRLVTEIEDGLHPWVVIDDLRLHQVLLNLAVNAVRFTSVGSVTIRCRRISDEDLRFDVVDTGTGINPSSLERLFQPFQQGPQSQSQARGTGLGLSISIRLIEMMGGSLDVTSEPGVGSNFSFTVHAPATEKPAQPEVDTDDITALAESSSAARALVVDDSPVNRMVISKQLETLGMTVAEADGGALGVEMATSEEYQLVIMDWHMPEVDGLEATRRIRSVEAETGRSHTPIMAMTASAMPGDRERCLDAGMDAFLAKPATAGQLARAVRSLLAPSAEASADTGSSADTDSRVPSFDGSVLEALVDDLGDRETVALIVETFLGDLDTRVSAVVNAPDTETAQREAHTLKSPSLMLGALELGALCQSIESGQCALDETSTARLHSLASSAQTALTEWANNQEVRI